MGSDGEDEEENEDVTRYVEMSNGFLTETQRLYLADEKSYSGQTERNKRQDIRDRTRAAFLDFAALEFALDPKDREIIFRRMVEEDPEETVESLRDGESLRTSTKHNVFGGTVAAIEFIYQGMIDAGIDPERVLNHVRENVAASELTADRLGAVMSKIEAGKELTTDEIALLKHQILEDSDVFQEEISTLDMDIESRLQSAVIDSKLGNRTMLSAGESFAALGYILEDPSRAEDYPDLPRLLHGEVSPFIRGDLPRY